MYPLMHNRTRLKKKHSGAEPHPGPFRHDVAFPRYRAPYRRGYARRKALLSDTARSLRSSEAESQIRSTCSKVYLHDDGYSKGGGG